MRESCKPLGPACNIAMCIFLEISLRLISHEAGFCHQVLNVIAPAGLGRFRSERASPLSWPSRWIRCPALSPDALWSASRQYATQHKQPRGIAAQQVEDGPCVGVTE